MEAREQHALGGSIAERTAAWEGGGTGEAATA
jgi:hypothetical protein